MALAMRNNTFALTFRRAFKPEFGGGLFRRSEPLSPLTSSSSFSTGPLSVFPWRHSSEPLERVVKGDNLSGLPVQEQQNSYLQNVLMGFTLKRAAPEVLFPSIWKEQLADDCSWAFMRGLSSLLAHNYHIPQSDILTQTQDDGVLVLSLNTEALGALRTSDDNNEPQDAQNDKNNEEEEDGGVSDTYLSQLFDEKLLEVYRRVYNVESSNVLLFLLQMRLMSCQVENIFSVAFSRECMRKDGSLLQSGRNLRDTYKLAKDTKAATSILKDLDAQGKPIGTYTFICDVSIQCMERFSIQNKDSGEVIAGKNGDENVEQSVTHLIRFEVVADLENRADWLGSWKIVDIDDHLKGNVWY